MKTTRRARAFGLAAYWLDTQLSLDESVGGWAYAIRRRGRPYEWVFRFQAGDEDNARATLARLNLIREGIAA